MNKPKGIFQFVPILILIFIIEITMSRPKAQFNGYPGYFGYPVYGCPGCGGGGYGQGGFGQGSFPWTLYGNLPTVIGPGGASNAQSQANKYGGFGNAESTAISLNLGGLFG